MTTRILSREEAAARSRHPPGAAHRWGRALFVAAGVGLVLAVTSGLLQAFEAECRELPREDLGLVELGQLRRVVDR